MAKTDTDSPATYTRKLDSDDVLDQESYAMLRRNRLANILTPLMVQEDDKRVLQYATEGMYEAQSFFGEHVFNRVQYVSILMNIANAFIEAHEYMLPADGLVASLDNMFVDERLNVWLVYVPLADFTGNTGALDLLGEVNDLLEPDRDEDNLDYLHTIHEALTQWDDFSADRFKKLLVALTIKPGSGVLQKGRERPQRPGGSTSVSQGTDHLGSPSAPESPGTSVDVAVPQGSGAGTPDLTFGGMAIPGGGRAAKAPDKQDAKAGKEKGGGLLDAILKKRKTAPKDEAAPKAESGAPAGFAVPGVNNGVAPGEATPPSTGEAFPHNNGAAHAGGLSGVGKNTYGEPTVKESTIVAGHDVKDKVKGKPVDEPRAATTDYSGKGGVTVRAFLVHERTGARHLISVTPFHMGRRQNEVDLFVEDNDGVSRVHATITFADGRFSVVDDSSRNGTFVNDLQLVPGVPRVLNNGDVLALHTERYEFLVQ